MKYDEYLEYLIGNVYKVLILKENNSPTINEYLGGLIRELIGNKELFDFLKEEPCYFSIINKMKYLHDKSPCLDIFRTDVFKSIHFIKEIKGRLNGRN